MEGSDEIREKHHPPAISIEPPMNGDDKLNGDLDSPSAELTPSQVQELFRQAQASPSSSSVTGSTRQQYQPAKCNEEKIKKLLENSPTFTILNENGQRRYCQPGFKDQAPPKGCEVFIGKLPPDCFEDELVPLLERVGKLRELRIMMEYTGTNRGYCFATYESRDSAKQSVREFNNYEVRKGKTLGVCLSVDNCRLFVGGIPKSKMKDDVYAEMRSLTEGVVDVIMYPSASDKTKNRGFAFVEYESHRAAAVARKKLMNGKAQLWGHQIAVDWAEPERFVDEDVMATVKILYVRNLMLSTTEEKLRELFSAVCNKPDGVERVKKIRDYAFVHFRERADALKCRDALNNTQLEGTVIEVCLAKPVDKSERQSQANANTAALHGTGLINTGLVSPLVSPTLPMYYDPTLFAMTAAGLQLPQMLGLPPVSPTLLDSAKLLAMQNALAASHHSMMANASSGGVAQGERLAPGMKRRQQSGRTAAGGRSYSASLASQQSAQRKPVELLQEFCLKHGLGSPAYNLHTAISHDGVDLQMYLFKVTIPMTGGTFTPNRLCVNLEEARQFAAEFVLQQLSQQLVGAYETPLMSPAADMRMTLPNPLLGNMGGLFPQLPLPQLVPTLPSAAMAQFLMPPNVTQSHAAAAAAQGQPSGQGGRPVDGASAQHGSFVVQQPARFDGAAPQYYDTNMTAVGNGAYYPQQPIMQAGPQANVAY